MERVFHVPDDGWFAEITEEHLVFVDSAGSAQTLRFRPADSSWRSRCVGRRKLDEAPWTVWIGRTAFVFQSYAAAYELLLIPLNEVGRTTFDTT